MTPTRAKDTSFKTGSLLFGREPVFLCPDDCAPMGHFASGFKAFT